MEGELTNSLRKYWLPLALAVLALISFVYGMIALLSTKSSPQITFETESQTTTSDIAVDVEGAVRKPGVHRLKIGSIVQDALIAAGGLSEHADREWIAKNINLASKVNDGDKIYLPEQGEVEDSTGAVKGDSSSLININSATASQLEALPGIGPVTAGKIIQARPFGSTAEILQKKVVGQATFEKIKDLITAQ